MGYVVKYSAKPNSSMLHVWLCEFLFSPVESNSLTAIISLFTSSMWSFVGSFCITWLPPTSDCILSLIGHSKLSWSVNGCPSFMWPFDELATCPGLNPAVCSSTHPWPVNGNSSRRRMNEMCLRCFVGDGEGLVCRISTPWTINLKINVLKLN